MGLEWLIMWTLTWKYPHTLNMVSFIHYVSTVSGFLDPLRKHIVSTENKQKLAFSDSTLLPSKCLRNIRTVPMYAIQILKGMTWNNSILLIIKIENCLMNDLNK